MREVERVIEAGAGPVPVWLCVVSFTWIDCPAPPVVGTEKAETTRSGGLIRIEAAFVLLASLDSVTCPSASARAMT